MTDLTYMPLKVKQGNDPLLTFMLSQSPSPGEREPYPDAGKDWEFYLKGDADEDDGAPLIGVRVESADTLEEIAVVVTVPRAMLQEPGTMFYRLDAVGSGRETVSWGPLSVIDV